MITTVTLRHGRVTPARPAAPNTGVLARSRQAGHKSPLGMCHTEPVFQASIHMTRKSHNLYPQATPVSSGPMTPSPAPTYPPTVQAGLLLLAVAGSAVAL